MGRGNAQQQLEYLFKKQHGKCRLCGQPATLGVDAVRFRLGGGRYGVPGTIRPKVMAHKDCAQEESNRIENAVPLEERQARAKRWPEDDDVIYIREETNSAERVPDVPTRLKA